jgi:hypothetical protein
MDHQSKVENVNYLEIIIAPFGKEFRGIFESKFG